MEYGTNRSIRIHGESTNAIISVALVFPETIAVSVAGKGIKLYDYQSLTQKTSLNAQSVSHILLNSTKLACIDSNTMIKIWNLYDHGKKSQFHGILWHHSHEIQDIQFYRDMIVSFDQYQCYFWSWNTKNCMKIINCGIQRAIIYKNIIVLFSFSHLKIFKWLNNQISKSNDMPLSFIIKRDDQFMIDSENIIIKTRLTEHVYKYMV